MPLMRCEWHLGEEGYMVHTKTANSPTGSRLLIVEDNADTAESLARLLRHLGHEVQIAREGPRAIEIVVRQRPEFVLLDIGLPGMDGYEVAARLRQEASCKETVIIAISGYGRSEDQQRSREAGIDHHLVKPIDHEALRELLGQRVASCF
jgi:CheY-like chemotaxis protein